MGSEMCIRDRGYALVATFTDERAREHAAAALAPAGANGAVASTGWELTRCSCFCAISRVEWDARTERIVLCTRQVRVARARPAAARAGGDTAERAAWHEGVSPAADSAVSASQLSALGPPFVLVALSASGCPPLLTKTTLLPTSGQPGCARPTGAVLRAVADASAARHPPGRARGRALGARAAREIGAGSRRA